MLPFLILLYLIVGGILMAILEEKNYLEIDRNYGYVLFPIFWLPLAILLIPYIITNLVIRKIQERNDK